MDLDTIKTAAMWILLAIAVVGILLAIVIRKVIGKVISLGLAAILVFFFWQQRDKVMEFGDQVKADACAPVSETQLPTFFGIKIDVPDDWCET